MVLVVSYDLIAVLLFLYLFNAGLGSLGLAIDQFSTKHILVGVKWGCAALCVMLVLFWLLPEDAMKPFRVFKREFAQQQALATGGILYAITQLLKLTVGMGIVSLSEEMTYRGLLYKTLRVRMRPWLATVVSAWCYVVPHGVASPNIFLMGCGNAVLLEKYGSLLPAVMVHFLWNIGLEITAWFLIVEQVTARTVFEVGFLITFLGWLSAWAALRIRQHQAVLSVF